MIASQLLKNNDLAPGDLRSHAFDWTDFRFVEVRHPDDPNFPRLYEALAKVFAPLGEMETAGVLRERLAWQGREWVTRGAAHRFTYQMLALEKNGEIAAVRDHTVIVMPGSADAAPSACVHLSHVYVDPLWRRTGLSGWMRAFPVKDARQACQLAGLPDSTPITLIAEMEPLVNASQLPRLKAYAQAGFRRVDPESILYHQPDFRSPAEIDLHGGPRLLPFWLMIRLVGREGESVISGAALRRLVEGIYAMYAAGFRKKDMQPLYQELENYPGATARIALQTIDPKLP